RLRGGADANGRIATDARLELLRRDLARRGMRGHVNGLEPVLETATDRAETTNQRSERALHLREQIAADERVDEQAHAVVDVGGERRIHALAVAGQIAIERHRDVPIGPALAVELAEAHVAVRPERAHGLAIRVVPARERERRAAAQVAVDV